MNHRTSQDHPQSLEPEKVLCSRTCRTLREKLAGGEEGASVSEPDGKGQSKGEGPGVCADLESKRRDSFKHGK